MTAATVLHKRDIDGIKENRRVHPFNDRAVIHLKSLGEAAGLSDTGVHLARVAPGDETTAFHSHELSDEFVYILAGTATLSVGDEQHELGPGDFAGFPANGAAHIMQNTGSEDLVYLMAGGRPHVDIVNYPRAGKKMYKVGTRVDIVDTPHIKEIHRG